MFEEKESRGWNWNWAGIGLVVIVLVAFIQIIRVNPPSAQTGSAEMTKPVWTEGPIISGVIEVPAGNFLTFPLHFNRRVTLNGYFTTGKGDRRLSCLIVPAKDMDKWKDGGDVIYITKTGPVPRGTIRRVIEPGEYVLVFDNRMNSEDIRIIESSFSVE